MKLLISAFQAETWYSPFKREYTNKDVSWRMIYKVRFKSFLSSDSMKVNTMMTSDFESAHAFSVYRKFSIWDLWKAQHKSILSHTCLSVQKWPVSLTRLRTFGESGKCSFFSKIGQKGMGRRKFISCLYKLLNRSFLNSVSFFTQERVKKSDVIIVSAFIEPPDEIDLT